MSLHCVMYLTGYIGEYLRKLSSSFLNSKYIQTNCSQRCLDLGQTSTKISYSSTNLRNVTLEKCNLAAHSRTLSKLLASVLRSKDFGDFASQLGNRATQPFHPQSFVLCLIATSASETAYLFPVKQTHIYH